LKPSAFKLWVNLYSPHLGEQHVVVHCEQRVDPRLLVREGVPVHHVVALGANQHHAGGHRSLGLAPLARVIFVKHIQSITPSMVQSM
jgi:hypothetical protein